MLGDLYPLYPAVSIPSSREHQEGETKIQKRGSKDLQESSQSVGCMNNSQNSEVTRIIPTPRIDPSFVLLAWDGSERLRGCQWTGALVENGSLVREGALDLVLASVDGVVVVANVGIIALAGEVLDGVGGDGAFLDGGSGQGKGGEDCGCFKLCF